MTLTNQQQNALNKILRFLVSDTNVFILRGYAGTGKTTLLNTLIQVIGQRFPKRELKVLAPTGRAAKILRDKSGWGCTIHSGIYNPPSLSVKYAEDEGTGKKDDTAGNVDVEESDLVLHFTLKKDFDGEKGIVIVDEASMVSSKDSKEQHYQFGSGNLLKDLLRYADLAHGGQIIFIGDDAQLPPVGDSFSAALSPEYFAGIGISTMSAVLTDVLRQDSGGTILANSVKIREALSKSRSERMGLSLDQNEEDFSGVSNTDAVISSSIPDAESIMIAFSNAKVLVYNKAIRARLFPGKSEPQPGDRLLITRNQHAVSLSPEPEFRWTSVYNGEFYKIASIGKCEERTAFVGEEAIRLRFADMCLVDEKGNRITTRVLLNLLDSPERELPLTAQKALFSDFINRNKHLRSKVRHQEMLNALAYDPYFNALHVKYGYAITCHKAQGGEWPEVYIDFENRTNVDDDSLRWAYTAITRASRHVYSCNYFASSPLRNIVFGAIQMLAKIETAMTPGAVPPETTPFHDASTRPELRVKYQSVLQALNENEKIVEVISGQFREQYMISVNNVICRFDTYYDKKGLFKPFSIVGTPSPMANDLIERLNAPVRSCPTLSYTPSCASLGLLYDRVGEECRNLGIDITNVVENNLQWHVKYYLITDSSSILRFTFDKNGKITYCQATSLKGPADGKLCKLIEKISG